MTYKSIFLVCISFFIDFSFLLQYYKIPIALLKENERSRDTIFWHEYLYGSYGYYCQKSNLQVFYLAENKQKLNERQNSQI